MKGPANEALKDQLAQTIQQVVRQEMQSMLIPAIGRIVLHTTEKNMLHPIQQSLEKVLNAPLSANGLDENHLVNTIAEQVRVPVRESFRDCFKESIIPSFQAATQKMLGQINSTITKQLSSRNELQVQIQSMQSQLDMLVKAVASLERSMQNGVAATADPVAEHQSDTERLQNLIDESKYEQAFEQVC